MKEEKRKQLVRKNCKKCNKIVFGLTEKQAERYLAMHTIECKKK